MSIILLLLFPFFVSLVSTSVLVGHINPTCLLLRCHRHIDDLAPGADPEREV